MDAGHPPDLHGSFADRTLFSDATAGAEVVGLSGILAARGHRARRRRVPGSKVAEGFRWRLRDTWSPTWWPQGVAVGEHEGTPLAMASWFAQPRRGREMGCRITIVDLRDWARPRYHHVLLVSPQRREDSVAFDPVKVHAGGIAWAADRLFVSATYGGIREFRLSDIVRVPSRGMLRRSGGPFGYRYLLPQFASYTPAEQKGAARMRYSFIASESGSAGPDDEVRLISGEYGKGDDLRLARVRLTGDRTVVDEVHVPRIAEMQGAVLHDGTWFVNASRGDTEGGDLWVGTPGDMTRHAGALPPGPEDIAVWAERNELWAVSEFPGKRWMYSIPLDRVTRNT
ncbi:MAG: hypothetical protein JWM50_1361 [Microbacteriaceae bacterium]|jgi:hypothetical protein|nr:hypothetical protein [Microbacteriaceae bacterium]